MAGYLCFRRAAPTGPLHIVDDPWTELAWAPILGPSAIAVWRRVALMDAAGYLAVDPGEVGAMLGLGSKQMTLTVDRLCMFGIAFNEAGVVAVRLAVEMPNARQRRAWPAILVQWADNAGIVTTPTPVP